MIKWTAAASGLTYLFLTGVVWSDTPNTATGNKCGGDAQASCLASQYCDTGAKCATLTGHASGTCKARPQLCPAIVAPVCGCDGKTYNNSCEANRAGVTVSKSVACNTN